MNTEERLLEQLTALNARLDRLEAKVDYAVERHRFLEDAIDELTPVGREAIGHLTPWFAELEAKGYVAVGNQLVGLIDRVVTTYGPDEVARLSDNIILLLDTVRSASQPDVLEVANEALDVVHHPEEVEPLGVFGMARATSDADVQRGMAMALQILRHLGRSHGSATPARESAATTQSTAPTARPAATPKAPAAPSTPPDQVVEWQGRRFDGGGFLLDPSDWDEQLAVAMAEQLGVQLDERSWAVVRWARDEFLATGTSPNVRRVASGSGVGTKAIYAMFPRSPGKTTAMLAGIPKPAGCV